MVTAPPAPTTSAPRPATTIVTRTYSSAGGSVTVRSDGRAITLVAVTPAPGWVIDSQEASSREVQVRFRSSTSTAFINIQLEDGHLQGGHDE
jgi:hypothetical protein